MKANFDSLKLTVEGMSGGKNTVIFDDMDMPSIMVRIPQMKFSELLTGAGCPRCVHLRRSHLRLPVHRQVPRHRGEWQSLQPGRERPRRQHEFRPGESILPCQGRRVASAHQRPLCGDCPVVQGERHTAPRQHQLRRRPRQALRERLCQLRKGRQRQNPAHRHRERSRQLVSRLQ